MVLRMARPQLHSRTKTYWFRKRVPADLVAIAGKKEEFFSLHTRDPIEAKRRYAEELVKLEQRWASLRTGPRSLTEEEAHTLARDVHDGWLAQHRAEPSRQDYWPVSIGKKVFGPPIPVDMAKYGTPEFWSLDPDLAKVMELEAWCRGFADHVLKERGLVVDDGGRQKLAKAIAGAVQRASETLVRIAKGELIPDGMPTVIPSMRQPAPISSQTNPPAATSKPGTSGKTKVTLTSLVEAWWIEAEKANRTSSTRESYTNTMRTFVAYLKHDDAPRVSPEDVIAFKDHRLSSRKRDGKLISARTVKNSDLAGLKTVFGFAVANRLLPSNPAKDVKVQTPRVILMRDKDFTKDEALRILRATRTHERGREFATTYAAKRWVPWLLAFSGGRVGEFVQMRRQDVRQVEVEGYADPVWVMTITPDAGTVKTKMARPVPVHPQLIALGFIDFVQEAKADHLFLVPKPTGDIEGPRQTVKNRLAEFVRELVSDEGVSPNHGWRHRFRTEAVSVGIEDSVIDAIGGWVSPSVGRRYGSISLKARTDAVMKLPRYKLD
ncbi:DUF6538 domain-containing protein [Methylobacterium sp. WL8]|uniref:DUF6538 domain-containing protein n=1 Tax=Methylobacterium sp. WL8 TaxID=2603899 RepID=UPI0011C7A80C|nr:DUF6538 domain-containing protein [Methylobacterium sp. WL8]TXN83304.1 tyrosine-type recombinase/integrase [Methylobacterium sp. WL8]